MRRTSALLALVLGCQTPHSRLQNAGGEIGQGRGEFVRVVNGHFMLGDKPFTFAGSNFYRLALADAFRASVVRETVNGKPAFPQIEEVMANYARDGLSVVRLWGFACDGARGTQAKPGLLRQDLTLNDGAMAQLDFAIGSAARHGLKVILPLVNFEHEYCGMEWWVDAVLGPVVAAGQQDIKQRVTYSCLDSGTHQPTRIVRDGSSCPAGTTVRLTKEMFYTEPMVKQAYENHVKALLQRFNTATGRAYRDEPAILAIEVANEPHTSDHYECMVRNLGKPVEQCRSEGTRVYQPGTTVANWLREITSVVKGVDKNHLVSSGEEGYRISHDDKFCQSLHTWIHDGSKGVDFGTDAAIQGLDFMTTHLYPDNWAVPKTDLDWFNRCVVTDRAQIAKRFGKPIIMEETGFSDQAYAGKPDDYRSDRAAYISTMFRIATAAGYEGTMIWQAAPLTTGNQVSESDSFTFPIKAIINGKDVYSPEGFAIVRQSQCMAEKRRQGVDGPAVPASCVFLCRQGSVAPGSPTVKGSDGASCFLPAIGAVAQSGPLELPSCPGTASAKDQWGWMVDQSACAAKPATKAQFQALGGCACRAR